jgi:UDPglucose--hexose-1-phosphate uridylyltransferase
MPEFRKDPLIDRWVIIASERAKRPQEGPERDSASGSEKCPFCWGNEAMTPPAVLVLAADGSRADETNWAVRVVPNKYPALVDQTEPIVLTETPYTSMLAAGAHEVVIESPKHVTDMVALSVKQITVVLEAYRERLLHWHSEGRWRYALIYKNQGIQAGATLAHVHSQITALPIVPKYPSEKIEAGKAYFVSMGRCAYCEMARHENENGRRMITENDQFIAFCPFAARVAAETWIVPKRHASRFEYGSSDEFVQLARLLHDILTRLQHCFGQPAFNYFLHNNPLGDPENEHCHWHLELLPKLHQLAGFELGSGAYLNPLPPEDAAQLLRESRVWST